jgi:hypothetical protein
MSYCTKCGEIIGENDSFCGKCGSKLRKENQLENVEAVCNNEEIESQNIETVKKTWWIEINGSIDGPFSLLEINNYYACKEISETTMLSMDNSHWITYSELRNNEATKNTKQKKSPTNLIAYLIAWSPIILSGFNFFFPSIPSTNKLIVFGIFNSLLCFIDSIIVSSSDKQAPSIGWMFFIPVYLYQRSKNLSKSQALLLTWLIAFFISIFVPFGDIYNIFHNNSTNEWWEP